MLFSCMKNVISCASNYLKLLVGKITMFHPYRNVKLSTQYSAELIPHKCSEVELQLTKQKISTCSFRINLEDIDTA